jgi:hypothetical protein
MAGYNLYIPRYTDTIQANLAQNLGIDTSAAIIYTYDIKAMWYRQNSPKKWILLSNGNSPQYTADRGVKIITGNIIRLADTIQGAGTKLQWLYDKAAFRAGLVNGTQWDISNIGLYSFSTGINNIASGTASIALGLSSQATGINAVAIGGVAVASGSNSVALGNTVTASGLYSTALGGYQTTASGIVSMATGNFTKAVGNASFSSGVGTYMNTLNGAVFGAYNDTTGYYANNTSTQVATNPIFVIGNGSGVGSRSNALTMLRNGELGIGTNTPQSKLHVKGGNARVSDNGYGFYAANAANDGGVYIATDINGDPYMYLNRQAAEVGAIIRIDSMTEEKTFQMPNISGSERFIPISVNGNFADNTGNIDLGDLDGNWSLTGNSGTIDGTNFIGTTDSVALNFRVNNQKSGRIEMPGLNLSTFLGYQAGNVSNANNNTAMGYQALLVNTSGASNTAVGTIALTSNITGSGNTAVGRGALELTTGGENTAVGAFALDSNTSGISNTAIGYSADVSTSGLTNATAIGHTAVVDASNKVRIGNTSVTVIEGQVAYTFPSDVRFKYNIKKNVPGLEFIKKLNPITYYMDETKLDKFTRTGIIDKKIVHKQERQLHTGFSAQEVEKAAKELGYEFDGVNAPQNKKGYYSVAYTQFVMPLVKAVQEQQSMIEDLKKEIEELKKLIK